MPHTQLNASQQYVQPHVAGPYDPPLHQPHVPQQQVQLHQGSSVYNTMPQVQLQHQYNTHNTYVHPTQPESYDASFPALPERSESPWHKVEYKKGHETTQNLMHNTSRYLSQTITGLTNHCPYSQTNTPHYQKTAVKRNGKNPPRRPPKVPPIFVSGVQNIQPLKELFINVAENDSELKILNGDQVKIQPSSTDKYHTIIKALAEKHTEFHTISLRKTEVLGQSSGAYTTLRTQMKSSLK